MQLVIDRCTHAHNILVNTAVHITSNPGRPLEEGRPGID